MLKTLRMFLAGSSTLSKGEMGYSMNQTLNCMILIDLSKTFHDMSQNLLTAELKEYSFGLHSVRSIANHISDRGQKVKVDSQHMVIGCKQILVSHRAMCESPYYHWKMYSFADDNTIFLVTTLLKEWLQTLTKTCLKQSHCSKLIKW